MDIWVALTLIFFGLLFLVLEVFVFPGVGVSGIVGILALGAGVFIAFKINTFTGMTTLSGTLISSSILVWLSMKYNAFSKMFLSKSIDNKIEVNHLADLKQGDTGKTISRLAPMGKARFGNMYSEVTSWDGFIDEDTDVSIVKINDNTIFVSPLNK